MVTLFRNKSFSSIFFLIILALLVHVHFFYGHINVVAAKDGFLSYVLANYVQTLPGVFVSLIYFLFLMLQSIRLNLFLNESKLFQQNGYTVAMTYILLSGFLVEWNHLTAAFLSNSLIILIIILIGKLYNNAAAKTLIFNIGLISGITVLAYHPTLVMLLVLLFALLVLRPFRMAEILILLIGVITPFYLLAAIFYLNNHLDLYYQFLPMFKLKLLNQSYDLWKLIAVILAAAMLISGFISWMPINNRMVIQIRKSWSVIKVMLVFFAFVPFIFATTGTESFILLTVPASAVMANVFQYPKRLFYPNFLFLLAIILIMHTNWVLIKF